MKNTQPTTARAKSDHPFEPALSHGDRGDRGEPTVERSTIPHTSPTAEQIEASKPTPSTDLTATQMAMLTVTNPNGPHRVYENQCSLAVKNMARKLYYGYWENSPLSTESWESLTADVRSNWCAAVLVAFPSLSQ